MHARRPWLAARGPTRGLLLPLLLALGAAVAAPSMATARAAAAKKSAKSSSKRHGGDHSGLFASHATGVRGMFEAAQALYDAGKYNQALAAYSAILRKYPAHEPAAIQLAKTLYRLDRIKDAYGVFARINPQHLDPETSYEYGWSFYTNKAWAGALYAFQRVPKGHALYDLANYYGAICAIKMRKYDDAADMLEKAVVLPDKLAKSRALYVKHVEALRLMQQKSALAEDRRKEKELLAAKNHKKGKKADQADAAKPAGDQPYVHKGLKYIYKSATVSYGVEHEYDGNSGLKNANYDAKISNFTLLAGPLIPLPIKLKDHQAAFGMQLTLIAEDRNAKGQEARTIIDESNQDLTRILNRDLGATHTKDGIVGAEPWVEFPLPDDLWLAAGGEANFTYVNFERDQRSGYRRGYTSLGGRAGKVTFSGDLNYVEILNVKTQPIQNASSASVTAYGDVLPKLTAYLTVSHELDDYLIPDLNLDGPDSQTSATVTLIQYLPIGCHDPAACYLQLVGGYTYQPNYIFHGIPTYGTVAADGQVASGSASLYLSPVPWLTLSVAELINKTTWQLDNEAARDPFELTVPDYVEKFTASVGINVIF